MCVCLLACMCVHIHTYRGMFVPEHLEFVNSFLGFDNFS